MKFIFPQNFNFRSKLLGIIDYPTAIFNIFYFFILLSFCNLFINDSTIKIMFIIFLFLPVFMLSIIDFNHENILYFFWYMLKYIFKPKLYLYQ